MKPFRILMILLPSLLITSACMHQNDNNEQIKDKQPEDLTGIEKEAVGLSQSQLQSPGEDDVVVDRAAHKNYQLRKQESSQLLIQQKRIAQAGMSVKHRIMDEFVINESKDKFTTQTIEGVKLTTESPVSTFSIDVDTGGYSTMRRWINQGRLPTEQTVRVEELVNYFNYDYPVPNNNRIPFVISTELAASPYNEGKQLLRVGLQGYEVAKEDIGSSHLIFLLDVSGSMSSPDKLPLLKQAIGLLTQQLNEQDKISIVVYAGASGVVLDGVAGNQTRVINNAMKKLSAGGGTNGSAGIELAYELAMKHFISDGNNRVILATDGDFNVGTTDQAALERLIQAKRKQGVYLTTLGFGQGNYNDSLMEQLADKGNGNYAYIDTLNEARKVLADELSSQIFTIANDVKIQVEFNPAIVAEYRLIGYQNRRLKREDFNNDKVDASEVGAGHNVTALYEISYLDGENLASDKLRYQTRKVETSLKSDLFELKNEQSKLNELAYIKLRYKPIHDADSQLLSHVVSTNSVSSTSEADRAMKQASADFRFAAAVAGFGQRLNGGKHLSGLGYDQVEALAQSSLGEDKFGYRHEFIQLVRTAKLLEQSYRQSSNSFMHEDSSIAGLELKVAMKKVN